MTLLWTYSGIEFDIYASVSPIADADFRSFRVGERHTTDAEVFSMGGRERPKGDIDRVFD
jgi:hypothetical protein